MMELIQHCEHDPEHGAELWDKRAIITALEKLETLRGPKAYLRVSRDRKLEAVRRETQGHHDSDEGKIVPDDAPSLFLFRLKERRGGPPVWCPTLRFPSGNYAIAFSFDR